MGASATSTARKNSSAPAGSICQAQQGRIQFWVRNLVRREGSSFFLQKADGRFYPDFLCQLPGAAGPARPDPSRRVQGRGSLGGAEDDRLIGGLWANLTLS
jgi:type III restriction enzyme